MDFAKSKTAGGRDKRNQVNKAKKANWESFHPTLLRFVAMAKKANWESFYPAFFKICTQGKWAGVKGKRNPMNMAKKANWESFHPTLRFVPKANWLVESAKKKNPNE